MDYIIALGGNIGDTEQVFRSALAQITAQVGSPLKCSRWHETEPLLSAQDPVHGQRNYLNGVILVRSDLSPDKVMARLLAIESLLGRIRGKGSPRWGPRIIDLDLIAAENLVLHTPELTLPHPEMHKRRFVLEPMLEVAPDWEHPLLKRSTRQLSDELAGQEKLP